MFSMDVRLRVEMQLLDAGAWRMHLEEQPKVDPGYVGRLIAKTEDEDEAESAACARELLRLFVEYVDDDEPVPEGLLRWLADRFSLIVDDNQEPAKALHLTRPEGRQPGVSKVEPEILAAHYLHLLGQDQRNVNERFKKSRAKKKTATAFGVGKKVVERAIKSHAAALKNLLSPEEIEHLGDPDSESL